jgi:hypothetical protein
MWNKDRSAVAYFGLSKKVSGLLRERTGASPGAKLAQEVSYAALHWPWAQGQGFLPTTCRDATMSCKPVISAE